MLRWCYNKLMLRSYKSSLLVLPAILLAGLYINTNVFADSNDVDFSITVNPSLTLALSSNTVNFSITPKTQGAYNSANFTVTSATNNAYGYTLVMGTSNVDLTSNTINPTTGTNPTIPTLAETQDGISAATFEASTDSSVLNHYGVAIGTGNNFNAMKTTKQVKKTTANNASGGDTTTIALASKLDLNTVPGTYSTTINFQMTANPLPGGLEEAYQNAGKTKATIGGKQYYAMQDMTSTICSNATVIGDVIEVYDTRDNTIYHIGKLADNKCWLLDNLALDLTNSTVLNNLTADNTNADAAALGYLKGTTSRNPSTDPDGNYATAGVANWTSDYSYSAPLVNMANKEIEATHYSDPDHPEYDMDDPLTPEVHAGHWKVGGHYNYCAASAGSYCYGDGTSEGAPSGNASSDICPSGWRLPSYGPSGEYQSLTNAITGGTDSYITNRTDYLNIRKALRLPLSGKLYRGSMTNLGVSGMFWSSTYAVSYSMDYLSADTYFINPQNSVDRSCGISVRCIAQ